MAILKVIRGDMIIPDFSKNIHYISWTPYTPGLPMHRNGSYVPYSGLSFPFAIVARAIEPEDPIQYFMATDRAGETGTLYPKYKVTLMPSASTHSGQEIYKQFADAVEAQQLFKAEAVIIDMSFYPGTLEVDDYEYYKMLEHNKDRFDLPDKEVTIYLSVSRGLSEQLSVLSGLEYATDEELRSLRV